MKVSEYTNTICKETKILHAGAMLTTSTFSELLCILILEEPNEFLKNV